jgi:hypothetical protein
LRTLPDFKRNETIALQDAVQFAKNYRQPLGPLVNAFKHPQLDRFWIDLIKPTTEQVVGLVGGGEFRIRFGSQSAQSCFHRE